MMSKYLMKSAAAIVLGLAATACSHDFDYVEKVEQQSIDNAQQTLGFYIPENQDWKMSSEANVNVTIPGDANETYTVMIFSNNPLVDGIGYYLTKQTLNGGQNLATDVAYPMHLRSLVIGITDSNGKTIYKSASIDNGKVTALSDISAARTRAATLGTPPGYPEGYSGAYPNANQWAAQGYNVPDPLTKGQKARIQFYFQTVKNPGGVKDYGQIDFFIQQVYDGCTDPITNYSGYTSPAYSLEQYPAASGGTNMIQSGEHMDHLVAGSDKKHIYNFNNGTCSTNGNVGDNGAALDTDHHSDEIMLMVNTKTNYFSYANSDASYVRPDRYTLVAGSVIDEYIENHKTAFETWKSSNNNFKDEPDDIVDDKWHRGFIGFDFDMLPDEKCLVCTAYDKDNNPIYDLTNHADEIDHYVYSNAHYGDATESTNRYIYNVDGTFTQYDSANPELVIDGLPIRYVNTNTNMYCAIGEGANIGIGGEDGFTDYEKFGTYTTDGDNDNTLYVKGFNSEHSDWAALNMKFITKLVRAGYLPVMNKGLKRWVKVGGCADGYYSDWIVSFLPADPDIEIIITHDPAVWSYAFEDNRVRCDFDMNDVVLRVNVNNTDPTKFDVTLVAAGCEYDNYVFLNGQLITWPNGSTEVHDALGAAKGEMINTGRGVTKTPVTTQVTIPSNCTANNAPFSILPFKKGGDYSKTEDQKESSPILITQLEGSGKAPLGIVVPGKWAWPTERTCIVDAYSTFVQWASSVAHITGPEEDEGGWYSYPTTGKVIVMP